MIMVLFRQNVYYPSDIYIDLASWGGSGCGVDVLINNPLHMKQDFNLFTVLALP
jgi:hypothetical protein